MQQKADHILLEKLPEAREQVLPLSTVWWTTCLNHVKWQHHPITAPLPLPRLVYGEPYVTFSTQQCSWGADKVSANADECSDSRCVFLRQFTGFCAALCRALTARSEGDTKHTVEKLHVGCDQSASSVFTENARVPLSSCRLYVFSNISLDCESVSSSWNLMRITRTHNNPSSQANQCAARNNWRLQLCLKFGQVSKKQSNDASSINDAPAPPKLFSF